jgi:hypothetical protein
VVSVSSNVLYRVPSPQIPGEQDACVYFAEFGVVRHQGRTIRDETLVVEECLVVIPIFSCMGADQPSVAIRRARLIQKRFHERFKISHLRLHQDVAFGL